MGILDRFGFRREDMAETANAININQLDASAICHPFQYGWRHKGKKPFAQLFQYIIFQRLFQGLRNVNWKTTEVNYTAEDVTRFIDANAQVLVYHYWKRGYAVVFFDRNGKLRLPKADEISIDKNGYVSNGGCVVIYSEPYQLERKSHLSIIAPYLEKVNIAMNNSDFVNSNLGAFGILSSKGIPVSPQAKQEFNEKLRKDYGAGDDKFQFILSNAEMAYTPINLNIKELGLTEDAERSMRYMCNLFGINPDYIFGNSTFSNQAEAVRTFYREGVIPLAEMLLLLARNVFLRVSTELVPSKLITYDLSNVPEMNNTLSAKCAEYTAYLDYLMRLRDAGCEVDGEIERLADIGRNMLADV